METTYDSNTGTLTLSGSTINAIFAFNYTIINVIVEINSQFIPKYCFYECKGIKTVTIKNHIAYIGDYAFYKCENLTNLNLPNSLKTIGEESFAYNSIMELDIPDNVEKIGNGAFLSNMQLIRLNIPLALKEIGSNAFNINSLTSFTFPTSMTTISENMLAYSIELTEINIPSGYTTINDGAFSNCAELKKVTLPISMKTIGKNAFNQCMRLEDINLPEGLLIIGDDAFAACSSLKNLQIPNTCQYIGSQTYSNKLGRYYPELSESKYIPKGCFYQDFDIIEIKIGMITYENERKNVQISTKIEEIDDYAFAYCQKITKIVLPDTLKKIGYLAFAFFDKEIEFQTSNFELQFNTFTIIGAASFSKMTHKIPSSVIIRESNDDTIIGKFANYNSLITSFDVPETITKIDSFAFYNCKNLDTISFHGQNLKNISSFAFGNCTSLTSINIPSSVEYIGEGVFYGCEKLETIDIRGIKNELNSFLFVNCFKLKTVNLPDNLKMISSFSFAFCLNMETIEIPESVAEINEYAFLHCESLKRIVLPNALTKISDYTFAHCIKLIDAILPSSLKIIGDSSFLGCLNLSTIIIPKSTQKINENAFGRCISLNKIQIPRGCTVSIGAFHSSNLSYLSIDDDVIISYKPTISNPYSCPSNFDITNACDSLCSDSTQIYLHSLEGIEYPAAYPSCQYDEKKINFAYTGSQKNDDLIDSGIKFLASQISNLVYVRSSYDKNSFSTVAVNKSLADAKPNQTHIYKKKKLFQSINTIGMAICELIINYSLL